jgi:GNAT superfamily N-acetyltransferase
VAEIDNQVVGLGAVKITDLLERPRPQCRITALVVGTDRRRLGLARELVATIEAIARRHGCYALEVTTQVHRADAAAFYLALGFEERRRRRVKSLAS